MGLVQGKSLSWDIAVLSTNAGSSAATLLFFVLLFRFLAELPGNHASSAEKGKEFVDILITAVTVIVVAIPGEFTPVDIIAIGLKLIDL